MAQGVRKVEKAYRENPQAPVFARLADLYLNRRLVQKALSLCQEGCERFPDYAPGYSVLSKCYEASDQLEEARSAMDRCLRIDPENPGGFLRISELYEEIGVATLAVKNLQEALLLDPCNELLAEQLARLGSPPAAAPDAASPRDPALVDKPPPASEQADATIVDLFQEIEAHPGRSPDPTVGPASQEPGRENAEGGIGTETLADVYSDQGLLQKALDVYQQLLGQDPDNQRLLQKIKELEQRRLEESTGYNG